MEGSGGSTGSRPLPTAPSGGLDEDKAGYLTPKLSRENLNDKTGYDELSNVSINEGSCADSYDKLARTKTDYEPEAIDGDYITPESEPTEEKKNPENSHTYFVLEKWQIFIGHFLSLIYCNMYISLDNLVYLFRFWLLNIFEDHLKVEVTDYFIFSVYWSYLLSFFVGEQLWSRFCDFKTGALFFKLFSV